MHCIKIHGPRFACRVMALALALVPSLSLGQELEESPPAATPAPRSLISAAKQMEARLAEFPQPLASQWKGYYGWEKWGAALARGETPQRDVLTESLPRFYGLFEGLDEPSFLRMREELKAHLEGASPPPAIGPAPSLLIRFDRELVDALLEKQSQTTHVHQQTGNWIAGAWVTGAAECRIDATAVLSPQQEQAAVLVRLEGVVRAPQTIAQSGRFRVYGSATSRVEGAAQLVLEEGAFRATRPQVTVHTESAMHDVDGPRPFRRLAMRVAQRRNPQGEAEGAAIIAEHVAQEAERRLEMEADKLNAALARYQDSFAVLKRLDIVPSKVGAAVVADQLQFGMTFSDSGADSLPTYRPPAGDPAVELVLHESFLSAFPRKFLKGVWWSAADFERLRNDLHGAAPFEAFVAAAAEPQPDWGARWDWRAPVATRITGEWVECELRFSHARIGDQWRKEGLVVRSRFQPVVEGGQIALRRVSGIEATALKEGSPLTDQEKAFFEARFAEIGGDAIPLSGLHPPTGAGITALSLLTSSAVRLEEGWLRIAFQQTEESWASRLAGIVGMSPGLEGSAPP